MRLCVVAQLPPRHDGEELDDAGHGLGLGARQGHQHREQQQRPVRDVALERLEHVGPALGGEAERDEGGGEEDQEGDQGLPATQEWAVVADGVTDHLHIAEHVSDADQDDQDGEQGGPQPAVVHGSEGFENQKYGPQTHTVACYGV